MGGITETVPRLRTARLEIVPGTAEAGRAEMDDRPRFSALLGAEVPASWPPPENDRTTQTFFTEYVERNPDGVGWAAWYILLRAEDGRKTAVGTCGFTGKPDGTGTVEAGYSILPEHQRRGYAPEALAALVDWAFGHAEVTRIRAQTFPELPQSIRVLEKCGFRFAGPGREEGTVVFERGRQAWPPAPAEPQRQERTRRNDMPASYVPEGSPTLTPYLAVKGVPALIDFLEAVFGAVEIERITLPDGRIMNAVVAIGNSRVMMGDPGDRAPEPGMLYVYVPDCDAAYAKALAAGATSLMPPADMFYGDRSGAFQDGSGNKWWVATHQEDVPHDEILRRAIAAKR